MRTPEEIHRYGKDVIEKHCSRLFSLNNGAISEIIDENNQIFRISDYRDWKYEVIDFIKYHDPDRIDKIERLFNSFELLFTPNYLSEIIGILSSSINNLKRKEKGGSPDNSQTAQTTNEPEPTAENPPKKKKKVFIWIAVLCIIIGVIAIIAIFYYFKIDPHSSAAIATIISAFVGIIGTIYAVLTYHK